MAEVDGDRPRLRPAMASMRLIVLDFVRTYIERWGASPSYGEIAAHACTDRGRVRKAVKSLAADGMLLRRPGPRGLSLPARRDDALRMLRELGYHIDETARTVTNRPLPPLPVLDYDPGEHQGEPTNDPDAARAQEGRG